MLINNKVNIANEAKSKVNNLSKLYQYIMFDMYLQKRHPKMQGSNYKIRVSAPRVGKNNASRKTMQIM